MSRFFHPQPVESSSSGRFEVRCPTCACFPPRVPLRRISSNTSPLGAWEWASSAHCLSLPIWRRKVNAGFRGSLESRTAAEEQKRALLTRIRRDVDDLVGRIPLIRSQLRLLEDVLILQAEESLRSAESAYAVGSVGALDLLDAERVVLEARTAAERTRADHAIALARLEGAIGAPLSRSDGAAEPEEERADAR